MDLRGSLVDNKIRIYPSKELENYINSIQTSEDIPPNILKFVKGAKSINKSQAISIERKKIGYSSNDLENLKKVKSKIKLPNIICDSTELSNGKKLKEGDSIEQSSDKENHNKTGNRISNIGNLKDNIYLTTDDIDWLYVYMNKKKIEGEREVPYLHVLFEGSQVELPENEIIKRNPILEARCVKLRAQQEAREYRKMTKSVDNVRMRFPEDSISYQMKQLNRQLIAIGQFIISIFAGFLFGFRGVEWMVGNLDFGFRLLLGVMCALVIALAEIYFLAKKLNEELNVPETVQLGGPPKFVNEPYFGYKNNDIVKKEHQD